MSRIDDLIAEHCPIGVERRSLGQVASYTRGVTYSKSDEMGGGPVRVLRSNNIALASNTLDFEDVRTLADSVRVRPDQILGRNDILMSAASGSKAHVGKVAFVDSDIEYCFGGFMAVIRVTSDDVLPRFLFHLLIGRSFQEYLDSTLSTTTINNLSRGLVTAFDIPVPPLVVQREIASVLDKLESLRAELEAELEAELDLRSRQYAFYGDGLLTFRDEEVRWEPMGDVVAYTNGKAHERLVDAAGDVPLITARFISRNGEANRYVLAADVLTPAAVGDIALVLSDLPRGRALARTFFVDRNGSYAINQRIARLRVRDPSELVPRFLFHVLDRNPGLLVYDNGSDQTHLSKGQVVGLSIPIPQVAEQERVVAVLDLFDALVNDLSIDLPAEIAARRQQYEYYRDRLLTFDEAFA